MRVPDGLKFAESLYELAAVHLRQKLGARLTIAVLAGKRPSIADHQIGGLLHEGAVGAHSLRRFQVKSDAAVDAAIAKVAEGCPAVLKFAQQLVEIAEIIAQDFGVDRGILPGRPGILDIRHAAGADGCAT